jgi:hypothetical protein
MHCIRRSDLVVLLVIALGSCAVGALAEQTEPLGMEPLFQLNPTSAADLDAQSRSFAVSDRATVLYASASVLQDMGFKVTGGEWEMGVLVGEKTADVSSAGAAHAAAEAAVVAATAFLSLLLASDMVTDLPEQVAQRIHVSLLVSAEQSTTRVRISIDRDMVYDHQRPNIPDHTELPLVYQEFFERLSRAIFFEGERL